MQDPDCRGKGKAASAAKQEFDRVLKKTVLPKRVGLGRDNHKKRVLNALPPTGVVDMSRGGTDWQPVCLIRTGTKNVSMQYTTENFTKLFEIVSKCLSENVVNSQSGAVTPVRKLRRTPSTGKTPRGLPGERQYWSATKGIWLERTRREVTTPPSGSGKSISKAHKNRVFKKAAAQSSRGSGPRPKAKKRASTQGSTRSKLVLAPDAASQSDDDDADDSSSSTNLFK